MRYLLDTNVLVDWSNPVPTEQVITWLYAQRREDLAISVLTYHEIAYGIQNTPLGRRRAETEHWLANDLRNLIQDRVIQLDWTIAQRWAEQRAIGRAVGRKVPILDAGIIATAEIFGLTIVTGDRKHFGAFDLPLINPWLFEI